MNIFRNAITIATLIGCILSIISLLDYHPEDPSYFHLTDNPVNNVMSKYGANIADPLIQAFGYAIIIPLIIVIFFCIMIILERRINIIILKITILIVLLPPLCFLFSIFDSNDIADGEYYHFHYAGYLGYFLYSEAHYSDSLLLYTSLAIFASILQLLFVLGLLEKVANLCAKISFNSRIKIKKTRDSDTQSIRESESIVRSNPEIKFRVQSVDKTISNHKAFDIGNINAIDTIFKQSSPFKVEDEQQTAKNTINVISQLEIRQSKSQFDIFEVATEKKTIPSEKSQQSRVEIQLTPRQLIIPNPAILSSNNSRNIELTEEEIDQKKNLLLKVLNDFGIRGDIIEVLHGPVVTLYCFEPVSGTKSSRVIGLSDDIARSMKAKSARISIVKGKNALGIELPNEIRQMITLREILESDQYRNQEIQLPIALGKNIIGEIIVADLAKMPHLLVAGTTGSGKSVAIHSMILSLIFKYNADQCKFIMIDPKMLELSIYSSIPHLIAPVVTMPEKAVEVMNWLVNEMTGRYRAMSTLGVRNISSYNNLVREAKSRNAVLEKEVQTGFDSETNQPIFESIKIKNEIFPYIVVIIDEMADLMLTAGKDIESSVQRLAQMARAAGIHLIMATQRPSVDIITGVIKANFPTRISFQVASRFDSRTILGEIGAEQLLGAGDMLYMVPGGKIERVHGTYVGESEVAAVIKKLTNQ